MPGPFELLFLFLIYCIIFGVPCAVAAWFIARAKGRHAEHWAVTAILFTFIALLILLFIKPVRARSGAFPVLDEDDRVG